MEEIQSGYQREVDQDAGGEPGAGRAAPAPAHAGATPSNTAHANSIGEGEESFRLFLRGVDSLYLSYQGRLKERKEEILVELRERARNITRAEQAKAQLPIGEHVFEVLDKGSGFYPFGLVDYAYRIRLASKMAKQIPVAVVQVSSEFLASVGVEEAERELRVILGELVDLEGGEKIGRVDLFADFASDLSLEAVHRDEWVTRAEEIHSYSIRRKLSGWTLGLGGPMAARLYNKTLEIESHSHKFFFHGIWEKAGWNPMYEVWRLEFELKRSALSQFGVNTLDDLRRSSGSLWRYLTTEWGRLAIANREDETRARWKTHPVWQALQGVEWEGNAPLNPRPLKKNRAPENSWYLRQGTSLLASFMAKEGIFDEAQGWRRLGEILEQLVISAPEKYGQTYTDFILEKVRLKQRQYNTGLNGEEREPGQDDEEDPAARAYRRASKGH